jgi:hypothetical protein
MARAFSGDQLRLQVAVGGPCWKGAGSSDHILGECGTERRGGSSLGFDEAGALVAIDVQAAKGRGGHGKSDKATHSGEQ